MATGTVKFFNTQKGYGYYERISNTTRRETEMAAAHISWIRAPAYVPSYTRVPMTLRPLSSRKCELIRI